MKRTMKAAVVHGFSKPLVIEEVDVPRPGAHEVLVKIEACGVCHTDLHAAEGDWPVKPRLPFIPGHEGVGHVFAVGADVGYVGHLPSNVGFVEAAPVLCAGVTVYKGLKVADTKPGNWVVISGIGGLGHMAVQYAKAMGLNVAAVDVDDAKLDLARRLGASVTVNASTSDPVACVKKEIGGAHGALVTAVSPKAFEQAIGMVRRGGTVSLTGLPPGQFPLDIFGMVFNGITVRGSIIGTRLDLQESLEFVAQGKVEATVSTDKLENINDVFVRLREGRIEGRVVLDLAA